MVEDQRRRDSDMGEEAAKRLQMLEITNSGRKIEVNTSCIFLTAIVRLCGKTEAHSRPLSTIIIIMLCCFTYVLAFS